MKGAVPYRDFFDVKPPLAFEFPAIFATTIGGDMAALHVAMTVVKGIAMVFSILLLGILTYSLTENHWSGFISGLVILSFPATYYIPVHRYLLDILMLLSGISAIYLLNKQYHFTSGTTAAIAVRFW